MSEWSDQCPVEPGWYWWKDRNTSEILYVAKFDAGLNVYVDGEFYLAGALGGSWWPERIEEPK